MKAAHIAWVAVPKPGNGDDYLGSCTRFTKPIDASKPCVVQSGALLFEDKTTVGRAVLSYHNAL